MINLLPLITSFGVAIAVISFLFNLRKDAHHVRLELSKVSDLQLVLGINNDSSVPFNILSVGYMKSSHHVEWLGTTANYHTDKFVECPIKVEARSLFPLDLCPYRNKMPHDKFGMCIQLETGRVYILRHELPLHSFLQIRIAALISRLSRGKFFPGMPPRPRLPAKPAR